MMKKIKYLLAISIALSALSCSKKEEVEEITPVSITRYPSEVYARIESEVGDPGESLKVIWDNNDRISLFSKYTFNKEYSFIGETGANSGKFKEVAVGEGMTGHALSYVYSVYPYSAKTEISNSGLITLELPAKQYYKEGYPGHGANTMVSATASTDLLFKNLCGHLVLQFYGEGVSVSSITLKGNNGEPLAGTAEVTAAIGSAPSLSFDPSGTSETITLVCETPVVLGSTAEDATEFCFVVPPTVFSAGFTITMVDPDGRVFKKSFNFSDCEIERDRILRLRPFMVNIAGGNTIRYTTYNGKAVQTTPGAFNAEIISNEYVKGEGGTIIFDGPVTMIGEDAFFSSSATKSETYESNLTHIVIPPTTMAIGEGAFAGCRHLASVTIQGDLESIGTGAFSDCSGLVSIIFDSFTPPRGLVEALKELRACTIFVPVEALANYGSAGIDEKKLHHNPDPSELYTIQYTSTDGLVVTPFAAAEFGFDFEEFGEDVRVYDNEYSAGQGTLTLDGPITQIGKRAFQFCGNLASITIPEGVKALRDSAFVGCGSLTSISIPESVSTIGISAFRNCSSLTSIIIPFGVTGIFPRVFYGCSSLSSISIPLTVTQIDDFAFYGCSGLTNLTLTNSLKSIGNGAFEKCSGLTSITIPNSVTSIGNSAFSGCSGLTSVALPDALAGIGNYAFNGCSGLTSITIPNSVTSIGHSAFSGCSGLTSVALPEALTSIGSWAFYGCTGLTSITIPNGVTSIDAMTFSGCSGLTSITIPNSVTSIGEWTFSGCSGLTGITIPNGVTSIGEWTFSGCSGLTSITIPNGVVSIGERAFSQCSGLTSVALPEALTSIGSWAFFGCAGLTSITIPNGVTSIGERAFSSCTSLTSVALPDSLTSIGEEAFLGCAVTSITIPNGVTSIDARAFGGCTGLASVALPDSLTSIGEEAFLGCAVTSITIPEKVESIGREAFRYCIALSEIRSLNQTPPAIGAGVFYELRNIVIMVPINSLAAYKKGWKEYADQIKPL